MHDPTSIDDRPLDVDVLMGRLIDGEGDGDDRRRFEALADDDPSLWRRLAERQIDGSLLVHEFERVTMFAETSELPTPRHARLVPRSAAYSAWAAMLIVGLSWALVTMSGREHRRPDAEPGIVETTRLDHESHFDLYLQAPYVIGEMQPIVLDVQEMTDGRIAVTVLRRIEEVIFVEPDQPLPVDANGELLEDAKTLRRLAPDGVD